MANSEKEILINKYFDMWIKRDFTGLDNIFDKNIYYSECYVPEYFGMAEINLWIDVMLEKQKVLEWTIKRFMHEQNTVIVEWFFKEQQGEVIHGFDGVSIIEFNEQGKIYSIKEFESKAEHIATCHLNNDI